MIYAPHILIGAAIGAKTHNLGLIIILGIVSHILLDKLPHWEYSRSINLQIKKFRETKSIKSLISIILRASIDIFSGLLIVFAVLWQKNLLDFHNLKFILLGIFFSVLIDITLAITLVFGSGYLAKKYFYIHKKYLHLAVNEEKEGMITFLGLFTQIIVIIFALILFFV